MKTTPTLVVALLLLLPVSIMSTTPLDDAIARLLSNMTVAEKARQLVLQDGTVFVTDGKFDEGKTSAFTKDLGAGVFDTLGRNVDSTVWNQLQRNVVASSRHGIGAISAEECQHGVQGDWHTIFPSPYTIAATFDRELMGNIGRVIGTEARAGGITQCWSPVCGLAREPRWGRAEEEMGEDTYLAGELAASMVMGMVGGDVSNLTLPTTVSPLLKHFAAHSIPESGRNTAAVHIGRREYQETFLPVFKKAVQAGAQGAMSSYNEVDGVPTTADHWLLTEKMRGEFGFSGYISSDFGAITKLMPDCHAVAPDAEGAVKAFLEAGGSVNGHDFGDDYEKHAANCCAGDTLDKAAGNVLRVKARLGLIPNMPGIKYNPYTDETLTETNLGNNPEHIAVALRAARESIVLVRNEASKDKKTVLPLNAASIKKLLVLGPNADEGRMGDYSAAGWAGAAPNGGGNIDNKNMITVVEGLKKSLPHAEVQYQVGAGIQCAQTGDGDTSPFWSTVQRHSVHVAKSFTPTAPSVPYTKDPGSTVQAGAEGLKATYFADNSMGKPVFERLDYAPSFHFFALGPDPTRLPSANFAVRWEGALTPDTTVQGALLRLLLCHGHGCNGDNLNGIGGRVTVDGKLVIDAWTKMSSGVSAPVDLQQGKYMNIVVEYWQNTSSGNPGVALQWSRLASADNATTNIARAASMVRDADAAVVVLGGANNLDHSATPEGEGVDRASLTLPGHQRALLKAAWASAQAASIPLVVVLVDGKPTAEPVLLTLPAVVVAFQAGQAQGQAIAEVLTGAVNPSGKLPVSFPVSADVLPVYYNRKPSSARGGWCDVANAVMWPFGHGLSYSTFNYSQLQVPAKVSKDGTVSISASVTNAGTVAGEEVAQLYIRDVVSSVTTPIMMLKGFQRVSLNPGESKQVCFDVDVANELKVLNRTFEWAVEEGTFNVMVGGSSDDVSLKGQFVVG